MLSKLKLLSVYFMVLFLCSCETWQTNKSIYLKPLENARVFNSDFNKVWKALIQTVARKEISIKTSDKESGVLTTEAVEFRDKLSLSAEFFEADIEIKRISVRPSVFMAVWEAGKYNLTFFVSPENTISTKVQIVCKIEAHNSIDGWRTCESKGVIEQEVFDSIEAKLK